MRALLKMMLWLVVFAIGAEVVFHHADVVHEGHGSCPVVVSVQHRSEAAPDVAPTLPDAPEGAVFLQPFRPAGDSAIPGEAIFSSPVDQQPTHWLRSVVLLC